VLAKAEGEPRDLSKNGRPKEPDLNIESMRVYQTYVPFDGVASLPFARKCLARSSVSQRRRDYQRHLEMALECVIVQLSKGQLSQDQARDIGWGLRGCF
jgi:hypothetical protein